MIRKFLYGLIGSAISIVLTFLLILGLAWVFLPHGQLHNFVDANYVILLLMVIAPKVSVTTTTTK